MGVFWLNLEQVGSTVCVWTCGLDRSGPPLAFKGLISTLFSPRKIKSSCKNQEIPKSWTVNSIDDVEIHKCLISREQSEDACSLSSSSDVALW